MYFISKKSENIWLIGLHNHNLYGIGDKDGQLFIYQKDVFDAGEWDEFAKLDIKIHSHKKCQSCERKMPAAAGIIETKLWIMASGTMLGKNPTKSKPHVFCVDLESKEVTIFKTKKSGINDFIKVICMHCDTLQINFEEEIDGKSRFMVLPNRLRTAALFMNFSNPFPSFKQFCFDINDEDKTCTFGYFYRLFNNSKGVFVAGITTDQFKFGIQNLMYDGLKQIPAGGDYRNYTMLNFVQNDDKVLQSENMIVEIDDELLQGHRMIYSEFYRDKQNELYCVIKEKKDKDLIELSIFKPNMDMENETVSLDFISSFIVDQDFPDVEKNLIFTAQNLFVFSSSLGIVTVINRVLTLSESAYLALQKNSISKKASFYEKIKNFFISQKHLPKESINNISSISMKYLRENCGIPASVSINHGNT